MTTTSSLSCPGSTGGLALAASVLVPVVLAGVLLISGSFA